MVVQFLVSAVELALNIALILAMVALAGYLRFALFPSKQDDYPDKQ